MSDQGNKDFIDNRDGNTMVEALKQAFGAATSHGFSEAQDPPAEVRISTAFFSPSGFERIAGSLAKVPSVRLMIGADLPSERALRDRPLGVPEAAWRKDLLSRRLMVLNEELRQERDYVPFLLASAHALRALVSALRGGNMEVRRYHENFLHAKAYIFSPKDGGYGDAGIIAGSSNLTANGLARNLELNLGRYDNPTVIRAITWFDELWEEAEPFDLAAMYEETLLPTTPWLIFLRVLWELYGEEIEEEAKIDRNLPLTSFQQHGVARAMRILRETGGVLVADEVGLGKSFIAGEILNHYRENGQRSLLICPAALRESTWKPFLAEFSLYCECYSYEQLANDRNLRIGATGNHLLRDADEYQLIIVDEAHNYRNPSTPTRAQVLRTLMFGRKRDLLLMTATPVNNSLWDLHTLLSYFIRQDGFFADKGILSIRERFQRAMRKGPSNLSPDELYPIIDATTVKRTRQFIKKHYGGDTITNPDGQQVQIIFPEPKPITVRYDLEAALPGFFEEVEAALDPDESELMFARYMPATYLLDGATNEEIAEANGVAGLLRSGLLKRFESSAFAFSNTLSKMVRQHVLFLEALDKGRVVTTEFFQELSGDDEGFFDDLLESEELTEDSGQFDVDRFRRDVAADLEILRNLSIHAGQITAELDPKLKALTAELEAICQQAEDEATDRLDQIQKQKVLIFSFFADTVDWIFRHLKDEIERNPKLSMLKGRLASVTGDEARADGETTGRQSVVFGFAPVSMRSNDGPDADHYDVLVTTDVLAEGVNLQQCRNIINFDMPWNPMRLVQRHGRIDRIGSPHTRVFLRTIFPDKQLDRLLKLEQRIMDKLAMAAASIGVQTPIEEAVGGDQVFTETREEIQKLVDENPDLYERGGTESAAQTGEEYRQTLRKALEHQRDVIVNLPWKVGSGMRKGSEKGVFFFATVGDKRTYLRFVRADEDWQPLATEAAIEKEMGTCLKLIETDEDTETILPVGIEENVFDFWDVARNDILADWDFETDPRNIQPKVRPLNARVAQFIDENRPGEVSEDRIRRALDVVETPWSRRDERMLRREFDDESDAGSAKATRLIEWIISTGLEPIEPPEPLPPIEEEEIRLIVWLAISPE